MDAEYAVIGVGAMGSFALWELASRGYDVVGFDKYPPGHDMGSSHGETRIFRTAYKAGIEYLPYLIEVRKLWKQLNAVANQELYNETGSLMIADERSAILGPAFDSSEQYNLPYEYLKSDDAHTRFPQHHFKRHDILHYDFHAGFVKPEAAIRTAAQMAVSEGARINTGGTVEKIEPDESGVTIHYDGDEYRVGHVIVAAGAGINGLLPQLELPIFVTRQIMFWFRAYEPNNFKPEHFPVFSRESGEHNWYGFPTIDGKYIKSAIHDKGKLVEDPDQLDRNVYEEDKEILSRLIKSNIPGVDADPDFGKVCMYTNTPDDRFVLGPSSKIPNTTLLGAGSGQGFKFAPVLGKLAAESAAGLETSLDIEIFHPDRLAGMVK